MQLKNLQQCLVGKMFPKPGGVVCTLATNDWCINLVLCKLMFKCPVLSLLLLSLQITKKQCCWSGALRLGFTSKDPSRINPDTLPKYACPDLVSQSGFWAKALPEEFANEGNIIAFWVDKKGRVFYRVNESAAMLFFSGVRTAEPLWALIDVYGLTRGVQLLGECWLLPFSGPDMGQLRGVVKNFYSIFSMWRVRQHRCYNSRRHHQKPTIS